MQNDGNRVPDVIGSLWEFDILALQRFSDEGHGTSELPERSLMFAVLLDAVEDFQKYALLQDKYARRRFGVVITGKSSLPEFGRRSSGKLHPRRATFSRATSSSTVSKI
jgi:hypothetical protein